MGSRLWRSKIPLKCRRNRGRIMSKERRGGKEGSSISYSLLGCWRVTVGLDMWKSWRWKNGLAFSTQQLAHIGQLVTHWVRLWWAFAEGVSIAITVCRWICQWPLLVSRMELKLYNIGISYQADLWTRLLYPFQRIRLTMTGNSISCVFCCHCYW